MVNWQPINLIQLCNNSLVDESLKYITQLPHDTRTENWCRTVIHLLPKRYQKVFIRNLIPQLESISTHLYYNRKRREVRDRVVNVVLLCISVDSKFCWKLPIDRELYPCDCVTHLSPTFDWCLPEIILQVAKLPQLPSLHFIEDEYTSNIATISNLFCNKTIQSLEIEGFGRPREITSLNINPILSANNITELSLVSVIIPAIDVVNLKLLTKLHTLYLDQVGNVTAPLAAQMACRTQLPDLRRFQYDVDSNCSFPEVVYSSTCPCSMECLRRLKLKSQHWNAVWIDIDNVSARLLELIGVSNAEEVIASMKGWNLLEPLDYDVEVVVDANFAMVMNIGLYAQLHDMYCMLKNQPHFSISFVRFHIRKLNTVTRDHLRALTSLLKPETRVLAGPEASGLAGEELMIQLLEVISESEVKTVVIYNIDDMASLREWFPSLTLLRRDDAW